MDGHTEIPIIKRTWVPTAAGASVRESAFAEKTLVMFVMVCWRAPLCYAEQREVWGIKSSAERERDELVEGKGKLRCRCRTTIVPKRNKAHSGIGPNLIFHSISVLCNVTHGPPVSHPRASHPLVQSPPSSRHLHPLVQRPSPRP